MSHFRNHRKSIAKTENSYCEKNIVLKIKMKIHDNSKVLKTSLTLYNKTQMFSKFDIMKLIRMRDDFDRNT